MQIDIPTNCPSCESSLVFVNDVLYCKNPECGSVAAKRVEHFASTLKIKGLGPSTISKLHLMHPLDIYDMTLEYITCSLDSEKLASKLFEEIEQSKSKTLDVILPALGIPLIGQTATNKLAQVCSNIEDITTDTCKKAGLGPKATDNLVSWLTEHDWYYELPHDLVFSKQTQSREETKGVVCITGKLVSFPSKEAARKILEDLGFVVKSSLTKDVTILINESGKETSKTQKARESGVKVVTDLKLFITENN